MNYRASGGIKRPRDTDGDADFQPAPLHLTAHPTLPLPLLSVAQSYRCMCVSAQLCDVQGAAMFTFVCLPPRVRRPLAGAPVYDMSLTHVERQRMLACALTGKLVRLLSLGVGCTSTTTTSTVSTTTAPTPITGTSTSTTVTTTITTHYPPHFEPDRNRRACHKLMQGIVRRVAARLAATVTNKEGKKAEELCASGQCAIALSTLNLAIYLGYLPSRALKAWLLIDGREGVAQDRNEAFKLVEEGARLGCHHCQGVMAWCYWYSCGCVKDAARSLELARESSEKGSRYGQNMLGLFYRYGLGGVVMDFTRALMLYRLAAAQNLDTAQWSLGFMLKYGVEVAQDPAKALEWWQLAAAQGHPNALYYIVTYTRSQGSQAAGNPAIFKLPK